MHGVKICGITDEAGLEAAITAGARMIGLVHFPKSPRHLSIERAAALGAAARDRVETALLLVDPTDAEAEAAARAVRPDWLQLHGRESPARASSLRRLAQRGVIKALGVAAAADLDAVSAYEGAVEALLFDAKPPPGAERPGGNAAAFDWRLLKGRRFTRPWMLSGGLTTANVAEAIRESAASAVDVSSGVERAPGLKDPGLIAEFCVSALEALAKQRGP